MFGLLVDRYQAAFLRKATYILRSKELAEDAVQETFIRIYKNADKFTPRDGANFGSWAYKILTNICYTYASRQAAELARYKSSEFADMDALGVAAASHDASSVVGSVLKRLPERFSRLLSLYFLEEKSYAEISEVEQISLSAVKSGLHRAKKLFKSVAIEMT